MLKQARPLPHTFWPSGRFPACRSCRHSVCTHHDQGEHRWEYTTRRCVQIQHFQQAEITGQQVHSDKAKRNPCIDFSRNPVLIPTESRFAHTTENSFFFSVITSLITNSAHSEPFHPSFQTKPSVRSSPSNLQHALVASHLPGVYHHWHYDIQSRDEEEET